jgi:outer membrane immunogenic protein
MKRKLSLAAFAICAFAAAPAFAADLALPVKAPPLPSYDPWNGWYIGANLGGSFGQARDGAASPLAAFTNSNSNVNGIVGGGQVGYNWHVSPLWLIGLEADFQGSSQQGTGTGTAALPVIASLNDNEKLPWFGTVRGRVGITPNPGWLIYATGGLAYGDVNSNETLSVGALMTASSSSNTVRAGWTAGGGVEAVVAPNWTVKAEYLYVDLGSFTNTFTGAGTSVALGTHLTDNIVRAGFDFHFPVPRY